MSVIDGLAALEYVLGNVKLIAYPDESTKNALHTLGMYAHRPQDQIIRNADDLGLWVRCRGREGVARVR